MVSKLSKISTLTGVMISNRLGCFLIVSVTMGSESWMDSGRGKGVAISVHSAVVTDRLPLGFHMLYLRYFGRIP